MRALASSLLIACHATFSLPSATSSSGAMTPDVSDATELPDASTVVQVKAVASKLPVLPQLAHVVGRLNDDSVDITFDPFDGAKDYRVYALPKDEDISVAADGGITVKNATYRCAGDRESPPINIDDEPYIGGGAIRAMVDNQKVADYVRTRAEATLGYVYVDPGPGLVPVYVLGESSPDADTGCYFMRWTASRVKKYTTSEDERSQLLADSARDDGVAFYVPAMPSADTTQVYVTDTQPGTQWNQRLYFTDGAEADVRTGKTPAFLAAKTAAPGTQPLMRVFYLNSCGQSHDELAVGQERFKRVYNQGDTQPWWTLLWSGVTEPTTLVVEALDSGCPFQGHLSATPLPSIRSAYGSNILIHQPFFTIDQVRATAANGEVFINGQHGPAWIFDASKLTDEQQPPAPPPPPRPKAMARSFIEVTPKAHPPMDFFADFASPQVFTDMPCAPGDTVCTPRMRQESADFTQEFSWIESFDDGKAAKAPLATWGQVLGEYWVSYADISGDTNGKYRLAAKPKATMAADRFLHVTMEVDSYSTARRYPQILISDRDAPIQWTLDQGRTLIVQPIGEVAAYTYPIDYQIQICKLRSWDVNFQCPAYDLHHIQKPSGPPNQLAPNDELGEYMSVDHRVLFDVFASTKRVYLFLKGKPYACAEMPDAALPSGPVTVTWGDVLYHSGVDSTLAFHAAHMQIETRRHFDNLGFSSGLPAPAWDEQRFPCVAAISF